MTRPVSVMKSFRNAVHAAPDARPRQPEPRRHVAGRRCPRAPGSTIRSARTGSSARRTRRSTRMKEIRKGMPEAKINDIGVAVVGGAIRTYLLAKDELPDESLLAMMPISIRPTMTQKSDTTGLRRDSVGGDRRQPVHARADHDGDRRGRPVRTAAPHRGVDIAREGVGRLSGPFVDGDVGGGARRLGRARSSAPRCGRSAAAGGPWRCTRW